MLGYLTFKCSQTRVALVRKGDVWSCRSQFFKTQVTPRQKVGMAKVAYHRMLVGGERYEGRQNAETRKNMTDIQLRRREMQ